MTPVNLPELNLGYVYVYIIQNNLFSWNINHKARVLPDHILQYINLTMTIRITYIIAISIHDKEPEIAQHINLVQYKLR